MTKANLLCSKVIHLQRPKVLLAMKNLCENYFTECDGPQIDYTDCLVVNHYMFDNTKWLQSG